MTSPYLHNGESIILTTDRISLDSVIYDAILTTERLILIDSRYARFEPVTIPLSLIHSVKSGRAATGEPVIILSTGEPDSTDTRIKNIIFSQQPMENRKHDRDLWLKKFIALAVSDREAPGTEPLPSTEQDTALRPSVRRRVAPEMIRPRKESIRPGKMPAEIVINPDEPEPVLGLDTVPEQTGHTDAEQIKEQEFSATDDTDNAEVISHDISCNPEYSVSNEGSVPVDEGLINSYVESPADGVNAGMPDMGAMPDPLPDKGLTSGGRADTIPETQDSLSRSVQVALESLRAGRDRDDAPDRDQHPSAAIRFTSPLPESEEPGPGQREHAETTVSVGSDTGVENQPADTAAEPGLPLSMDGNASPIPEIVQETTSKEPNELHEEPTLSSLPVSEIPPINTPVQVSNRRRIIIAGSVILCLLLVAAGLVLMTGVPQTEQAPVTVIPTTVPTPAPEANLIPSPTIIPQEGVWVRIVSAGYFSGQAGNPGLMQQISGSGERIFKVLNDNDPVKVSVEKQENTGDELLVEIYKNGRVISSRSVTAPMGSVDLLIDPITEKPPGIITTKPTGNITATGRGQLEYY